jgi:hypothetical protein
MSKKYRATIPFIPSMGSVSPIVCNHEKIVEAA